MIKLLSLIQEMQVNQPIKQFKNNEQLFNFSNRHIREFVEQELNDHEVLKNATFGEMFRNYDWDENPENFEDEGFAYNTLFQDIPQPLQQRMINYLVEKGLTFFGEWASEEDDDDYYGISWDIPDLGLIYNWTDKADPGSYIWYKSSFKGREFYLLNFNV